MSRRVNRGGRSGDPKRNCPSCDSLLTYLDIRGARYWLTLRDTWKCLICKHTWGVTYRFDPPDPALEDDSTGDIEVTDIPGPPRPRGTTRMGSTGHTFRLSFTVGDGEAEAQGLPEPDMWTARDFLEAARLGIVEDLAIVSPGGAVERYKFRGDSCWIVDTRTGEEMTPNEILAALNLAELSARRAGAREQWGTGG